MADFKTSARMFDWGVGTVLRKPGRPGAHGVYDPDAVDL